jgi:putative MATE family efflux protein
MWDRPYLSRLYQLSLPIMLQNLFVVLGSIATVLMVGQLGDVPMAAIGLANQLYYILSLVQFGISSGSAIFTAQFWGDQDTDSIQKVLGVSLLLGLAASTVFAVIALLFPTPFLHIFTTDEAVIRMGTVLLRIVGISYFFTPVINSYSFILRSTGNARLPMLVSTSGVLLNILLGYTLVFGKLGFPAMGAQGAAFANLIARVTESILLVWMVYKIKTPLAVHPRHLFSFSPPFTKMILGRVLPVMTNEFLWSLGISAYNAVFARISTESIAAIGIKESVDNLIFVPFLGITHATSVLVGNAIGSGDPKRSQGFIRQSIVIIWVLAILLGAGIGISRHAIASLYQVSAVTQSYAANLLLVLGFFLWVRTCNTLFFLAMMRGGGDTRFAYRMDVGSMWLVGVPAAVLAAFVFKLPVYYVYLAVMSEECLKLGVCIWRYRSRRWIHDLVSVKKAMDTP